LVLYEYKKKKMAFFIHFGSLVATLIPFKHWRAILKTTDNLGGLFYIFFSLNFHLEILVQTFAATGWGVKHTGYVFT
jgi:hypothetical protein